MEATEETAKDSVQKKLDQNQKAALRFRQGR